MAITKTDTDQLLNKVKLFEAIVNRTQDGLIVFNHRFEVIFANILAGQILKFDPDKLKGLGLFNFIPKEKRTKHDKLVEGFNSSGKNRQNLFDWRDIQCCRIDGSLFPAKIIIHKFELLGQYIYIVSLRDMTEVNNQEEEKNQAELNQFLAEQQRRCTSSTLQLNMENSVKKIAQKAQNVKTVFTTKQIQNAMDEIVDNAYAALNTCEMSTYISEPGIKKKHIKMVDRSLQGTFDRIRFIMDKYAVQKELAIQWDIPKSAANYKLQHNQAIEQVIYNVVDDAISNSSAGKISIQVPQLHLDVNGSLIISFQCSSSRFGIEQSVMNKVLRATCCSEMPADTGLKYNGMCLRLAKYLTEKRQGNMSVMSHPIAGTDVNIILNETLIQ